MLHNTLSFTILLLLFLASYPCTKGLTIPLIPPMSPQSPFYPQILEANNISTTAINITLDQNHFMKWYLSKQSETPNEKGEISFHKDTGVHVMEMFVGSPMQSVFGVFDTGSDLVWFQCKDRAFKTKFTYFNQTESFTYSPINCTDTQKCKTNKYIKGCDKLGSSCEFNVTYADGTNAFGVLSTEDTTFIWPDKEEVLIQFRFGCSWDNSINSMGMIGASNSEYSLPKQLYHDDPKFSYCISRDMTKTNLVNFGPDAKLIGQPISVVSNPNTEFYYIPVIGVKVDGVDIDVPPSVFEMSPDGLRGFIIDSGTALTHLTSDALEALKNKIEELIGRPPTQFLRFEICYNSNIFGIWTSRPSIGLEFKGYTFKFDVNSVWGKMVNSNNLECVLIIRGKSEVSILGSVQLQDVNVGHDPINQVLFLQETICPTPS